MVLSRLPTVHHDGPGVLSGPSSFEKREALGVCAFALKLPCDGMDCRTLHWGSFAACLSATPITLRSLITKVAKDVKAFCPRFNALAVADKRAYWAYFLQALAGAEAGLRSTADVHHTTSGPAVVDGVSHRMVRGEGLLQLTFEDADRYGCDFNCAADKTLPEHDPQKTISQPQKNLLCGVKILTNQLIDQRKPLFTR